MTSRLAVVRLPNGIGLHALIIGSALMFVAGMWLVEDQRLRTRDLVFDQLRIQTAATDRSVARTNQLAAIVTRLREHRDRIAAWRRDAIVSTNTIVRLGNALPRDDVADIRSRCGAGQLDGERPIDAHRRDRRNAAHARTSGRSRIGAARLRYCDRESGAHPRFRDRLEPPVNVTVIRTTAFFGVLVVLAGYMFVYRTMETAIAQRDADIDTARSAVARRLALERSTSHLVAERMRLERDLRALHVRDDRAAIVERFLRATARIAGDDRVAIQSVLPALDRGPHVATVPAPLASPAAAPAPIAPLEEVPLDLALRGTYADVIRATRDPQRRGRNVTSHAHLACRHRCARANASGTHRRPARHSAERTR